MGRFKNNDRIGVYVPNTHWAHALIAQNAQLHAALDDDDDVLLNRLLVAGASPNVTDLSGRTLLAIAIADGQTRCRAVLEAAGASRGLPKRPSRHKKVDGDVPAEASKKLKGSGLTNPPTSVFGAACGEIRNGVATFNLHWKRATNTGQTLCDDEAPSTAEKSWMLAYAGVEFPRTLSLIVWRRSSMILMMVFNLIHALVLLEVAWHLHTVVLAEWIDKSNAPREMINVPETLFWSDDPVLNAEIRNHEFQKPKGYKPRFYWPATQCLHASEGPRCPGQRGVAIEGHADDLRSWHQSYIDYHTVDGNLGGTIECPESVFIDPAVLTQRFRRQESCSTLDQLLVEMRTVVINCESLNDQGAQCIQPGWGVEWGMRTVPDPLLGMCEGQCITDRDCKVGLKCKSAGDSAEPDQDLDGDEALVASWCTGVPKFNYCFPAELEDANDGCRGNNSPYTCDMEMFGFTPVCVWHGDDPDTFAVEGECIYAGTLNAVPSTTAACEGCNTGLNGDGTAKQNACAAIYDECALILDTAQRLKMKALATNDDGHVIHTEAAVMGSQNPLFSGDHAFLPEPSSTEPFTTRTKHSRRYFAKVLSLCGSNDPDLPDRDPGPAPLPQGWTKLCDEREVNVNDPCDEDDISYRNQRTNQTKYDRPTLPPGTCTIDTIGERLADVNEACKYEYFPHPTIRRYGNKTDCLDYRQLAGALRDDEFIESCSVDCASVFVPFVVDCNLVLNALADHGEEFLGPGKSLFPKVVNVLSEAGELCERPTPRNCNADVFDGNFDFTLFDGERQESIPEYAGRLLRIAVAVIVKGVKRGEVMVAYVMAGAGFLAWFFNLVAMSSWYNMKKSIKWIRIGWACAFLAPFLISTYPMKSFIDLQEANGVILTFRDTLNLHFLEESIQAAEYADDRANASHSYTTNKLEQALVDFEHDAIATERDFVRFGAEVEEYTAESFQATMDSIENTKAALAMQLRETDAAYTEARADASEAAVETSEQGAGMAGTIEGFVQQGYDALQYTCDLVDQAADYANTANDIDNSVPWGVISDVDSFLQSVPVSIGFSTRSVNLGCIDLGWFGSKCFRLPSISFTIPMPWYPLVRPLQLLLNMVPTSEVIDDEITDVKIPQLQENCSDAMRTYDEMIQEGRRLVAMIQDKAAETQDRALEMMQRNRERQAAMRQQVDEMKSGSIERASARRQSARAIEDGLRAQMIARNGTNGTIYVDTTNLSFVNGTSGLQAPSPTPPDTTELVGSFVDTLQLVLEIMYGAVLGVQNMPMMIPAVLSMVAGMLKASLAVKVLVPGSSLPGVFIIVLPLITTPMFWAIFNVIFQIVGGLDLLLGLMLMAFLPCLNTFVGTWKQVARPMNDAQIADYSDTLNLCTKILTFVMVGSFSLFIYKVYSTNPDEVGDGVSQAAHSVVQSLADPIKLLSIAVATLSKKFYTALVCVDYMIETVVADRKYEKYLLELKRPPEPEGCCSRKNKHTDEEIELDGAVDNGATSEENVIADETHDGPSTNRGKKLKAGWCHKQPDVDERDEEEEMLELVQNKQVRLDDLCKLLYVGEDEAWMEKKKIGIAAVRQMRDATWQAAAKKSDSEQPIGMLNVTIHSFSGTGAVKNAYVVLELEQKDSKGVGSQCKTFTTDAVQEGSELDCEFKLLEIFDISAVKLYVHVYESVVGPDNFMGEAMWDTPSIVALMGQAGMLMEPQELPLGRCTQPSKIGKERFQQEKTGTIRMSVSFVFPQLSLGTLQVKVVSGSGLRAADKGSNGTPDSSDPFVIVSTHQIHDGKETEQKFVTKKIMKTLEPEWNETFFFDIWDLSAVLYLDVYDSDTDQDDYLGQGKLNLRDHCVDSGKMHSHIVELTRCFKKRGLPKRDRDVTDVTGTVQLELTFAEDRSRLELKSGLDTKLDELIAAKGFSEQQAMLFRAASDEEKMKFINSVKVAPSTSVVPIMATPKHAAVRSKGASNAEVVALFDRIDVDHNGVLNLDEFAAWWLRRQQLTGTSALDENMLTTMREQWAKLDSDGSGDLSCDEFGILLSQLAASDWEEAFDPATGRSYFVNAKTNETRWQKPDGDDAVGIFMETNGLAMPLRKPPALGSLKPPTRPAAGAPETVFNPVATSSPQRAVPQRAVPQRAVPARPQASPSRALPARSLPPR